MKRDELIKACRDIAGKEGSVDCELNGCGVQIDVDSEAIDGETPGFVLIITDDKTQVTGEEREYCSFPFDKVEDMVDHIYKACA